MISPPAINRRATPRRPFPGAESRLEPASEGNPTIDGRAEDGISQQVRDCATIVWSDLAAAYWRVGQSEEGLAAVTEALNFIEETDERYQEATLYFLKGWLTLQHKSGVRNPRSQVTPPVSPEEAEGYFHRARAMIARQQQAKSIELIATTSLAWLALWRTPDEKKAAHQMLSEVYNGFTEGFDTQDLKNAKALLETLAT